MLALLTVRVRYASADERRRNCCTPRCCAISTGNQSIDYNRVYFGQQSCCEGLATFQYAISFVPRQVLSRGDGSMVTNGDMFICFQTIGYQKSGPGNCTNQFSYDHTTCSLAVALSECQSQVQHLHTDVKIQWFAYLPNSSTVEMMTSSPHLVGWHRDIDLTTAQANPIKCPAADNTGPSN